MLIFSIGFALLIALIFAVLFSALFRNRGPWGSFWVFLIILFLGMWAASLWFEPVGPVWYGIAWADMLLIGLFLALLLGAAGEAGNRYRNYPKDKEVDIVAESKAEAGAVALFGVFFWIFMLLTLALVIVGLVSLF